MRISCFSMGPVFPKHNHGGSQKILRELCSYLGEQGHKVNILCPEQKSVYTSFKINENVTVYPILGFKPTYPEPYYTPPYCLRDTIFTISSALNKSDVFYIHDAQLLFRFLFDKIPTVVSFRDFIYPDTLAGGFSFDRDALIINSEYTLDCVRDIFYSFRPRIDERIYFIPNGINLKHFCPQDNIAEIRDWLSLSEEAIPILFPHRPDPKKGMMLALDAVKKLKDIMGKEGELLKLLVPVWTDRNKALEEGHIFGTIYDSVLRKAKVLNLENQIIMHPWVPFERLPEYYSLGKASLCIGNFVESFGSNSSVESEACGTPCVISRVASQRFTFPEEMVYKVGYGDIEAIALALREIIENKRKVEVYTIREYIAKKYSFKEMLKRYESVIINAKKLPPLKFKPRHFITPDAKVKLPIWCFLTNNRIYHDYRYEYTKDPILLKCFGNGEKEISIEKLLTAIKNKNPEPSESDLSLLSGINAWFPQNSRAYCGYPREIWLKVEEYIKNGYIIPVSD